MCSMIARAFAVAAIATTLSAASGCGSSTDADAIATRRPAAEAAPVGSQDHVAYLNPVRERDSIDQAIADGFEFLALSQQPDGSWGTGLETRGTEIYSRYPGSLDSFKTAATALAVMAFQRAGGEDGPHPETYRKALNWLKTDGRVRRDQPDLMYNIWAHTYALEAMADQMIAGNGDPQVRETAEYHLDRMLRYETVLGGWNYYDFDVGAQTPAMEPTSFGTASGLLALKKAREAGLEVPDAVFSRGLNRLQDARRPDGAFLYGSGYRYGPNAGANKWQGSAGRSQAGTYAMYAFDFGGVGIPEVKHALEKFDENWIYLNIGRKRPFPHEAIYQNSGYYYYYGHYHAAKEVEALPPGADKLKFAESVRSKIMPFQEADGSWWDYAMWDFHKPYGTGYALLSLIMLRDAMDPTTRPATRSS